MVRSACLLSLSLCAAMSAAALLTPAVAGMNKDLEDCTAADRRTSAEACTRVMNSGRLYENQYYIGHYNRGWAYFNTGAYDKALADFDKSIKLDASYADTYLSRAVVQIRRGARDAAFAESDLYLEKKGETAEAHIARARLFRSMNEPNRAFEELQRAATLDPGDEKIEAVRAVVLADLGELGPARAAAEKAISSAKSDDAWPYYARAVVNFSDKKFDDARTDVQKALSIKDKFTAAHALDGKLHEEKGETEAAIASFRRAVDSYPKAPDAIAAKEEARERLVALNAESAPAKVAASESNPAPAPKPQNRAGDCRRFIPSAGTTISVDCAE